MKTNMKTITLGITGLSGILLASCGGDAKNSQSTTPATHNQSGQEGTHNPCEEAEARKAVIDVSDWNSWTKVNQQRIHSKGHNNMWVDIYVPAEHADAYTDASASLQGMKIVKAQYPEKDSTEAKNLTVMVRDESTESNWYWGVYDAGGQKSMDAGQIDSCISCHDSADDMLFRQVE